MTRKNASKETINILINNAKSAISDSEHILKNTELIKSRLSTFDGATYIQLLFELLIKIFIVSWLAFFLVI